MEETAGYGTYRHSWRNERRGRAKTRNILISLLIYTKEELSLQNSKLNINIGVVSFRCRSNTSSIFMIILEN